MCAVRRSLDLFLWLLFQKVLGLPGVLIFKLTHRRTMVIYRLNKVNAVSLPARPMLARLSRGVGECGTDKTECGTDKTECGTD